MASVLDVATRSVLQDLTTVRATTVVAVPPEDGAPPPMEAMLADILDDLRRAATEVQRSLTSSTKVGVARSETHFSSASFGDLQRWARTTVPTGVDPKTNGVNLVARIEALGTALERVEQRAITTDIDEGARHLLKTPGDTARFDPRRIDATDARTVRKAYAIRLAPIAAATTVTVDGDVVTSFADDGSVGRAVMPLHAAIVGLAFKQWQTFVGLISALWRVLQVLTPQRLGAVLARLRNPPRGRWWRLWVNWPWLIGITWELLGQGGTSIVTSSDDGDRRIATLVQLDADFVTATTEEGMADQPLVRRHGAATLVVIERIRSEWEAAERQLRLIAVASGVGLALARPEILDTRQRMLDLVLTVFALILPWLLRRFFLKQIRDHVLRAR